MIPSLLTLSSLNSDFQGDEIVDLKVREKSIVVHSPLSIVHDRLSLIMNRRSFFSYFSLGFLASCFPVVLAACAPGKDKTADDFTAIGSVADLDKNGQIQAKNVLVLRDPQNPNQLYAVNPTCTHKGCTVEWKADKQRSICPCHDSNFAADGKLLKGPASKPLATYQVKIVGDRVLVKV